jgi:Domain of unknown function (DUF6456)
MSPERILAALAAPEAVLAPRDAGGRLYGVFADGDRRRRPRLSAPFSVVQALAAQGTIAAATGEQAYRLTAAGRARVLRQGEQPFIAQHAPLEMRPLMDPDGEEVVGTAQDPAIAVARLARMRTADGAPWLDKVELAAARRLAADAEAGSRGGMRTARWAGDSVGGGGVGVRGANGAEAAMAAGFEARRRVQRALSGLAAPLRTVAEAVCLHAIPLEALERRHVWPARSAKVALKLALSQLAEAYRRI